MSGKETNISIAQNRLKKKKKRNKMEDTHNIADSNYSKKKKKTEKCWFISQ